MGEPPDYVPSITTNGINVDAIEAIQNAKPYGSSQRQTDPRIAQREGAAKADKPLICCHNCGCMTPGVPDAV